MLKKNSFIKFSKNCFVAVTKEGDMYNYYFKDSINPMEESDDVDIDDVDIIRNSPKSLTKKSNVGKKIYETIYDNEKWEFCKKKDKSFEKLSDNQKKSIDKHANKKFKKVLNELNNKLVTVNSQLEEMEEADEEELSTLYQYFEERRAEYDFTPLQMINEIANGLGVGESVGIVKAYISMLQTVLGLKGTNVIAIGEQSSGKTFTIEQALDMIPDYYTHRGTMTKPSFFTKFNGANLDGHLFYLGDLGGDNDDDATKDFRNTLKELSTDGYVQRQLKEDKEVIAEEVTGHPSLCYTTVNEGMINDQERSRSFVLTPPVIDSFDLMCFNGVMEAKGEFYTEYDLIMKDKESIKGLTNHLIKTVDNVEMFNPYQYIIHNFFKGMRDFNRKIKEFNILLKLVCILNDGAKFMHKIYGKKTTLYVPRKEEIMITMHLFQDGFQLLPKERGLIKGLAKIYDLVDEDDVLSADNNINLDKVMDGIEGKNPYIELKDGDKDKYFTITDIRKFNTQGWYKAIGKDNLPNVIDTLCNYGFIIKAGQIQGSKTPLNLYCLPKSLDDNVLNPKIKWDIELTNKAVNEFGEYYPDIIDDVKELVESEKHNNSISNIPIDIHKSSIYDLVWEDTV